MVHDLDGIYGGGANWVNEPEECLEARCWLCNVDNGEVCAAVALDRPRWLRDGEHVTENGRGDGKDDFMSVEVLELGRLQTIRVEGCSKDHVRVGRVERVE